jgi:hypothetical protein
MIMKNKLSKIFWLSLLLSITLSLLFPTLIYADTAVPNLTAINETHAWRNVLESNDYLLVARYNVAYGANPVTDISDTFAFRLMDTTNTIELGVVEAYPYQNDGYGQGVVSWYFPASSNLTWNSPYWIRIEGKIPTFTSPPIYNINLPSTTYSSYTSTIDIQNDIASKIISMANTIGRSWTPNQTLTEETESGTVLSQSGESYFRPVIPGIQSMCPGLFILQQSDVNTTPTVWSTNQSDASEALVQNSTLGPGISGWASLFSMSFSATAAIPIIIICVILVIVGSVQGNMLSGLINSSLVLSSASLFGWFPMGLLMLISFGCGVYILYHLIFKGG